MSKSYEDRVKECTRVLLEMRDAGVPEDTDGYRELRARMKDYIKTGDPWQGKIQFAEIERVAHVLLPRPARAAVELTLRKLPGSSVNGGTSTSTPGKSGH